MTTKSDTVSIPLSRGLFAVVDLADYETLSKYKWCAWKGRTHHTFYALRAAQDCGDGYKTIRMHRLIAGAVEGQDVDHIDGNGLNNTRGNLRVCSRAQNTMNQKLSCRNRSGKKGVYLDKRRGTWSAEITCSGKKKFLGSFKDRESAASAYDVAARLLFGEFARTNEKL